MWKYEQSTGRLSRNDVYVATGYSGSPEGKNDPDKQNAKNVGPLPRGKYRIGKAYHHAGKGPVVMTLYPDPANEMFGRSGFLIHGDSIKRPGTASQGCIILPRPIRETIAKSPDKQLEVVA